jgi:glycosyltransferase involved in cell wall biosynthesis
MNILLITPFFYPHKGGSQQYAEELYAHLMALDPSIQVDVLCYNTDQAPAQEIYRGMHVYRVPCVTLLPGQFALPNYVLLWQTLRKLHRERNYALINSHTRFFENSWWTPFAARRLGTRSLLTDHCAFHPNHRSSLVRAVARFVDGRVAPFFCAAYDDVTVTNQATYAFVQNLGIQPTAVIYGGVDTETFSPAIDRTATRSFPGIDRTFAADELVITFVGRMIYSKGPQLLTAAAEELGKRYPMISFVFVGGGELLDSLRAKHSDRVYFTGPLFKADIATILAGTDILVHPSMHHEGFPNVLLEAGAAGCTVIATPMGGSQEIVIDGETGKIINPDVNAIIQAVSVLIEQPELRAHLAGAIRNHVVKQFSWREIAQHYHAFVQARYTGSAT